MEQPVMVPAWTDAPGRGVRCRLCSEAGSTDPRGPPHVGHSRLSPLLKVFQRGQDPNVYLMPSSAARVESTFRARVRYVYNDLWSEWSPTVLFGERPRPRAHAPRTRTDGWIRAGLPPPPRAFLHRLLPLAPGAGGSSSGTLHLAHLE